MFKFELKLLQAANYFSWSNDMEIIIGRNGLWRFVDNPDEKLMEMDARHSQRRDSSSSSILIMVRISCKPALRIMNCSWEERSELYKRFVADSEFVIDAKLMCLKSISLNNSGSILMHSDRTMELIEKLYAAIHIVFGVEQRRALLQGFSCTYDVPLGHILRSDYSFEDTAAKLIVRESRLWQPKERNETDKALPEHHDEGYK